MNPLATLSTAFVLTTSLLIVCAGPLLALDYYVDALSGDDADCGLSPDHPWKTITHALDAVSPDEASPATIHIAPANYSVSTNGETFPLTMKSYVRLAGQHAQSTVLDAEYEAIHVVVCQQVEEVVLEKVSAVHGAHAPCDSSPKQDGACGVLCTASTLLMQDCIIADNLGSSDGFWAGGILCVESDLILHRCLICRNSVYISPWRFGIGPGGIRCRDSTLSMSSCVIKGNQPEAIRLANSVASIETSMGAPNATPA